MPYVLMGAAASIKVVVIGPFLADPSLYLNLFSSPRSRKSAKLKPQKPPELRQRITKDP